MKVKEVELTFTLIDGKEEEEFLKKASVDMADRRKRMNNQRGGRKRRHEGDHGGGRENHGRGHKGGRGDKRPRRS